VTRTEQYTVLTCRAPHPVRRLGGRPHLAHLGTLPGEWEPTGAIRWGQDGRAATPAEGRAWAWCPRCRAATEYRRVA